MSFHHSLVLKSPLQLLRCKVQLFCTFAIISSVVDTFAACILAVTACSALCRHRLKLSLTSHMIAQIVCAQHVNAQIVCTQDVNQEHVRCFSSSSSLYPYSNACLEYNKSAILLGKRDTGLRPNGTHPMQNVHKRIQDLNHGAFLW